MLDVGLIGAGPLWETRYRPALRNLRSRIRVRSVQSAVGAVAEALAAELRCEVAAGVVSLAERTDLRAVLVLDPCWYGESAAALVAGRGKPVFLGLSADPPAPAANLPGSPQAGMIMPELPWRYSPATHRLREVLATRLGRVRSIRAVLTSEPPNAVGRSSLINVLDWCRSLIGESSGRVVRQLTRDRSPGGEFRVTLEFQRHFGGEPVAVEIACRDATTECTIVCERGQAVVGGPRELTWSCSAPGQERESATESLEGDSEGLDVMLDHFRRRVIGGLVPVPTLDDVLIARQLAASVNEP